MKSKELKLQRYAKHMARETGPKLPELPKEFWEGIFEQMKHDMSLHIEREKRMSKFWKSLK